MSTTNFHELQSMVFSPLEAAYPSSQSQTLQGSRKRRAMDDNHNTPNYKRPFHEDLGEKENCNREEAVVYEDLSLSSANGSHQNYRNVNQQFPTGEQIHVPFFPDLKFYNQTSDASPMRPLDCSPVTQVYDQSPQYKTQVGDGGTVGDEEAFAMVPARMALLSASVKYKVTVGELKRRINHPECLHASLINGILRKAKAKDGGDDLRRDLLARGIELPAGRRKILPNTAFTALTETEAMTIAKDYKGLLRREFKSKQIAAHMLENRQKQQHVDLDAERERLHNVRKFCMDLQGVISRVGEHPSEYNEKENREEIDEHVNHFSLVTHGFGNIAMSALLETIIRMVDESQSMLGTPLGQHEAHSRGQRSQGNHQQQYVSPAMQLPNPGFMRMGYAPYMGAPQYMMGPGAQPQL